MLSFQKLRVDQRSVEFLALVLEIIRELLKGHAELADQLLAPRHRGDADEDEVNESTSTSKFSFTFKLSSTSTSTSLSDWHCL
jgi:hypothetical protein